jgi:CRISPR-associated protein Cmr6
VSFLPLPPGLRELSLLEGSGNRSLLFDRGMDRYDEDGKIIPKGKEAFLSGFAGAFRVHRPADFAGFLDRRGVTFASRGAQAVDLWTGSRLVIGLGLPHPIETGFLFDRMTGCPYLPGSSVKGLLRAAARGVRDGDLEGDRAFWTDAEIDRHFGPEIGGDATPQTGALTLFDAFPTAWPDLEVDVLTPHYGKHYRQEGPPADWDKPVPVMFLAIKAGTPFRFYVAGAGELEQISSLLTKGLEWLGIGAKKSAGYGIFQAEKPAPRRAEPARVAVERVGPRTPARAEPPPVAPKRSESRWPNVELVIGPRGLTVYRGKQSATASPDFMPEIWNALRKKKKIVADVVVTRFAGEDLRIVQIETWKVK